MLCNLFFIFKMTMQDFSALADLSRQDSSASERETKVTSRNVSLLRGDSTRTSLKEAVLLRKFHSDRKSKTRWDINPQSPSDDAKDLRIKTEELRKQLFRNRIQLDHLLQHVPQILKSQKTKSRSSSTSSCDLNGQTILALPGKDFNHRNVFSHSVESSSDEELREPMAENLPNLSDEDSLETFRSTSDDNHSSNYDEGVVGNTSVPSRQSRVVKLTRTSSSASNATNQHEPDQSATNPMYHQAKPRPPPRRHNLKKKSQVNGVNFQQNEQTSVSTSGNAATQPHIVNLPYVSRRTSKERLRRSSLTKETVTVTIDENVPLETLRQSVDMQSSRRVELQVKDDGKISNEKEDASPSRTTVSSSGYSSLGSHNGSLSSSNSNASSTGSGHLERTLSDRKFYKVPSTISRSETQISDESDKPLPVPTSSNSPLSSHQEDEDVFPITKWVESSEYEDVATKNTVTKLIDSKTSLISQSNANRRCSFVGDNNTTSVVTQSKCRKVYVRPQPGSEREQNDHSSTFISTNSISMVEQSQSYDIKNRNAPAPASIKMRFAIPIRRSKKTSASRNSRAFAMHAKDFVEIPSDQTTPNTDNQVEDRISTASNENNLPRSNRSKQRTSSLSPESFTTKKLEGCQREISASLANLDRVGSSDKQFNTVSGATGRHLSDSSSKFFRDEYQGKLSEARNCSSRYQSTSSIYKGSTWSLNPEHADGGFNREERKSSFRHRLKGAFSFQNIRKAISMERLDGEDKIKSVSHSYLNEFGEDISQVPKFKVPAVPAPPSTSERLYKTPSISSIFSTVRMRKRKSRERRAAKMRNTIAVDPKQIPEYECSNEAKQPSLPSSHDDHNDDVGTPAHFRPIGRVLQMDVRQGTLLIEMVKPPSGPFGFYLARSKENGSVYISSMSDSYPDKMYSGLMKLGDEVTEVNGTGVDRLSLDEIYNIILTTNRLVLRIKPSQVHAV